MIKLFGKKIAKRYRYSFRGAISDSHDLAKLIKKTCPKGTENARLFITLACLLCRAGTNETAEHACYHWPGLWKIIRLYIEDRGKEPFSVLTNPTRHPGKRT